MPRFGKFFNWSAGLGLLALSLLSSCSHKDKTAPATVAAVPAPVSGTHVLNPAKTRGVTPVSLEAPLLATTEPYHMPTVTPPPTKAEQISSLLTTGTLVESKRSTLVFARTRPVKKTTSSMYADAILLGKVRRSLASAKLPGDFPVTATVSDAVACLKLDASRSAEISARAIDAVLKTPGIAAVEVRLTPAAQL